MRPRRTGATKSSLANLFGFSLIERQSAVYESSPPPPPPPLVGIPKFMPFLIDSTPPTSPPCLGLLLCHPAQHANDASAGRLPTVHHRSRVSRRECFAKLMGYPSAEDDDDPNY